MRIKVACIIVTYNRLNSLKKCIDSINNQTHKFDQILIVDNSTNSDTQNWIKSKSYLTTLHQRNIGGAGGFNVGISRLYKQNFDWVFLVDDDVILRENLLKDLLEFIRTNQNIKIGAIQPLKKTIEKKIRYKDGAISWNFQKLSFEFPAKIAFKNGFIETNNFSFEGVLISTKAIKKIGLPIKEFFIGFDDIEYSSRIKKCAPEFKIILLGKVLIENSLPKLGSNCKFLNRNFYVPREFGVEKLKYYYRNQLITFRLYKAPIYKFHKILYLYYREFFFWNIFKIIIFGRNRIKSLYLILFKGIAKGLFCDLGSYRSYLCRK